MLDFLNGGTLLLSFNQTFFGLIPEVQNPVNVNEFRPISLCNMLYKLIAKILVKRLKIVLPL